MKLQDLNHKLLFPETHEEYKECECGNKLYPRDQIYVMRAEKTYMICNECGEIYEVAGGRP